MVFISYIGSYLMLTGPVGKWVLSNLIGGSVNRYHLFGGWPATACYLSKCTLRHQGLSFAYQPQTHFIGVRQPVANSWTESKIVFARPKRNEFSFKIKPAALKLRKNFKDLKSSQSWERKEGKIMSVRIKDCVWLKLFYQQLTSHIHTQCKLSYLTTELPQVILIIIIN